MAELKDLNVEEVLGLVNSGKVSAEDALVHEKEDKNRQTLISKLESLLEDKEQTPASLKVKLLKNVKHNDKRYKVGQEIEVSNEELKTFVNAGLAEEV